MRFRLAEVSTRSCQYQPRCPGCPHFDTNGLSKSAREKLKEVGAIWGVGVQEIPCPGFGSRYRVRLSVRGRPGKIEVGIFERGSHRLVHIPECPIHHPSIEAAIREIIRVLDDSRVPPYDESRHGGLLRALQIAVEPPTGKVQVVLLVRDSLETGVPSELVEPLKQLRQSSLVQGIFVGALPHRNNALLAERVVLCGGHAHLVDTVRGVRHFYPPGAFGQANPVMHALATADIERHVPLGGPVVEYYAGVGTIGLGLLKAGCKVTFNEVGVGSLEGLRQGIAQTGVARTIGDRTDATRLGLAEQEGERWRILEGSAGNFAEFYGEGDTVIVDPPRKGLDAPLLERLVREAPRKLIYLSCGIDSLLAESAVLRRSGSYAAECVRGYAYFPFTDHVETLLVLKRGLTATT